MNSAVVNARVPPHAPPLVTAIDRGRGSFGMALFIATEAMLFAILFGAYYYLGPGSHRWQVETPPRLNFVLPALVLMILAAVFLRGGARGLDRGVPNAGRWQLAVGFILGLAVLYLSWRDALAHLRHLTPQTDAYGSIFYTITGLHAAHLILGLLMLIWLALIPDWQPSASPPHRSYQNITMYWEFLAAIYLILSIVLYIWPQFKEYRP